MVSTEETSNAYVGTIGMREDVLKQVFRAGGIEGLLLIMQAGRALIGFRTGEGVGGVVHTKVGRAKLYRVETAMRFLAEMGAEHCFVDLKRFNDPQVELDFVEMPRSESK
jgi:hypothetical protein